MVEKRTNIRVTPPEGSLAFNQLSETEMGRLVDVSASGFLLAGRENIKPGMIFQLNLKLGEAKSAHFNLGAECIWADLQVSGLTFAGFQIIDISETDQQQLLKIIEQLAVN